jgi:hypothetical protein
MSMKHEMHLEYICMWEVNSVPGSWKPTFSFLEIPCSSKVYEIRLVNDLMDSDDLIK